jgi:hypothetical protein
MWGHKQNTKAKNEKRDQAETFIELMAVHTPSNGSTT